MTIDKKLNEIQALIDKSTPGPWDFDSCGDVWSKTEQRDTTDEEKRFFGKECFRTAKEIGTTPAAPDNPNAVYIAKSRTDFPRVVQALRLAMTFCPQGLGNVMRGQIKEVLDGKA